MTQTTRHPLVAQYIERLEHAAARLGRGRRAELIADIEAHLAEAVGPDPSDAEVLSALDRLGEPEEVVGDEAPPPTSTGSRGLHEWAAIWLLLLGGLVAGIGWLAGLVLLWSSRVWTNRDKWIGTLVVPGGLALPLFILAILGTAPGEVCDGATQRCTGGVSTVEAVLAIGVLAIAALAPIGTAVYLARRAAGATTTRG